MQYSEHAYLHYICPLPLIHQPILNAISKLYSCHSFCGTEVQITHHPLRLAATKITQGHISKAKVKPSRASLSTSPIRDAFWRHPALPEQQHFWSNLRLPAQSRPQALAFPPEGACSGAEKAKEGVVVPAPKAAPDSGVREETTSSEAMCNGIFTCCLGS